MRSAGPSRRRASAARRWAGPLLAGWLCIAAARAQEAPPSFALEVAAPPAERELLLEHLALPRYRAVPDLDEAELDRLLVLAEREARELLATRGFFSPRIRLRREATRPPRVVITVEPGTPTRVAQVHIDFAGGIARGADPADRAQAAALRRGWALPPGRVFTQDAWDDAKATALQGLQARRYPGARMAASLADVDPAAAQARLGLRLDSGPPVQLGPLAISGLRHHPALLVERLARLPPGADYDRQALQDAQQRLSDSGFFDAAFVHLEPPAESAGMDSPAPVEIPVQVQLREAPLQRLVLGAGLSTDSGPRASIEHRHLRVPGIGWRADTRLQLEARSPAAETEWTGLPDARGWRPGVLARAERQRDGGQVTDTRRVRVGRSRPGDRIDRHLYLQWDHAAVRAAGPLPPQDRGDGSALAAHYGWTLRAFDPPAAPRRGHGLGLELGAGWALSEPRAPFQRSYARGLWLQPLAGTRLQWRAEAGVVAARDDARVPSTQLFRTGGDTSVRGYGLRDIGARRADGSTGPGRLLAVGSAEWLWPIRRQDVPTGWEQAVFVDAGAVADRLRDMRLHTGIGLGLRYASPVGPLRADLAWGQRARRLRLHLSVGVVF